jgi:hypothetical protein
MRRDGYRRLAGDQASIATVLALALLTSACSAIGGASAPTSAAAPSSSSTPPPQSAAAQNAAPQNAAPQSAAAQSAAAQSSPSISDKISRFFAGSSAESGTANTVSQLYCPFIDIREGASTLSVGPTGDNAALALKYQGTFVRAARQCAVVNGQMVMKVGVEGRIIVGPAGGPGEVDIPLRIAVVEDTVSGPKPIVSKFIRLPVTVPPDAGFTTFTHIEDALSFPLPPEADLENYTVYIGFDPLAAEEADKLKGHAAAKAKLKPKRKPAANLD